jgi:hypothetical protein
MTNKTEFNLNDFIEEIIKDLDKLIIDKLEKSSMKELGWNNALLNVKKMLLDKLAGEKLT